MSLWQSIKLTVYLLFLIAASCTRTGAKQNLWHFWQKQKHFSLLTSHLGMQIILSFGRGRDRKLKRCCFLLYYKLCYCSNYLPRLCPSYLALSLCNCDFSAKLFCLQAASFVPHKRYWVCSLSPPISPLLDFQTTPGFDLGTFLIQVDVKWIFFCAMRNRSTRTCIVHNIYVLRVPRIRIHDNVVAGEFVFVHKVTANLNTSIHYQELLFGRIIRRES